MSKKVISIVLSAAMLIAMLVVGVGAVTASAADTVTYYFCAPDAYLATNNDVGVYYWEPEPNAAWPGAPMTKATEVGYNVYKTECPDQDATSTIIFNAFVDAGEPADPELAAVAHQTININVEGYTAKDKNPIYEKLDNMYNMIYVLADDDAHRKQKENGAYETSGEWFSIDPSSPYYYKKYADYFGTYDFVADGKDALVTDNDDSDTTPTDGKQWHEGDTVKVALMFGGLDNAGTLTTYVDFDPAYLSYTGEKEKLAGVTGTVLVNDNLNPDDGFEHTLAIGCVFDPTGEEHAFAGDKVALWTFTFKALKDFNVEDLGLSRITTEITKIDNDDVVDVLINDTKDPSVVDNYTELKVDVICDHTIDTESDTTDTTDTEDTDTTTSSTVSSETVSSETVSSETVSSETSSTTSNTSSKTSSNTSSDKKDTGDASKSSSGSSSKSASNGGSNNNNNTAATVQTAGTFAVVSLVVILMAAAAVVLYTRKKTEE